MRTWADYRATMRAEDELFVLARGGTPDDLLRLDLTPERINQTNAQGNSPLMLAAYNGNFEVAASLLKLGANPNALDSSGRSILMGAAFKGNVEIVRLLVEGGAELNALNDRNQSALDFAQMFGRANVAAYLKSVQSKTGPYKFRDFIFSWKSFLFPKKGEFKHG